MVWEGNVLAQDVGKGGISVLALERRGSVEHFIDENAQRPPIHCTGVATALDHLGGNVLLGADK